MADPKEMKFDRRILNRNLSSGAVGKDEYENYLKNLKDVAANAEVVEFGPPDSDVMENETVDRNTPEGEPTV